MAALPYVPTWVLSPDTKNDLLYIIRPSMRNSGIFELLALNTTQSFDANAIPLITLLPQLPFSNGGQSAGILPAVDNQGKMLVYTGDCTKGSQEAALWQFVPTKSNLDGNGTWQEVQLSTSSVQQSPNLYGSNYLASAIAFSSTTSATAALYVFGGMCPNTNASTASDWIQNADYSNNMLTMEPARSSTSPSSSYNLSIATSRSPPVAEAGFSITSLAATFSESSDNQLQSVNQNFVLVGGHTGQAFINMSQVALFSLPEQTWSFISVAAPSKPPPTDLAARVATSIDSRSGHTATLTPDGNKIIVFGGWVGDVNNPADPQLAILELGQGYGGSGGWRWAVPTATGSGLPEGKGLYGHGAAMIAGDVMLVMGGYEIPTSSTSKGGKAIPSPSINNYLFNTTSSSFITSYTHPAASSAKETSGSSSATTETNERVGLGVGLTLGILALVVVVVIYFWYSRRLKRRRDARDDELRNLAAGAQRFHLTSHGHNGTDREPKMTQAESADEGNKALLAPYAWKAGSSSASTIRSVDHVGPDAARTGLLYEIPSPTRGLRRSLHSRGMYQPAPLYDDGRRDPLNTIHPIDERDEYDGVNVDEDGTPGNNTIHRRDFQLLNNVPILDPFQDLANSRTPSPQSPQERKAEIQGWVNDWNEADALMNSGGRLSPGKTDRTSSTLSDASARSMQSYSSIQRSTGGLSRTFSQRSTGVFSSAPLRSTNNTTPQDDLLGRTDSPQQRYGHGRSRSMTSSSVPQHHANSYDATACTDKSFPQLQHESDALLGDYGSSGDASPTKIGRRAKGWMGSMRRVFTMTDRSSSDSPENLLTSPSALIRPNSGERDMPRRAASTGGMFWQTRQGAKDWDTDAGRPLNNPPVARPSEGEEDWDVESAVERRVVQVMFTVPKEKLRVVNKGPDGDGESVMSSKYEDATEGE